MDTTFAVRKRDQTEIEIIVVDVTRRNEIMPADLRWLEAAARIAMPYRGTTAENPTVGAIVVSPDGRVLGRGVTAAAGRPHAEPQALAMAGPNAKGATLYVTLEPCNHWGKTPPCVDAVLESGVARVVCGASDPDPRTGGQSIAKMRAAGIVVALGQNLPFIERLHEGFFSRVRRGRPFVAAKLAISRDGMIGRSDRGNVAITGEDARRWTHMQRALSDAVIVGGATARLDDPKLTVRLAGLEGRAPLRVVISGRSGLPSDLNLLVTTALQPTAIIAENSCVDSFSQGAEIIGVAGTDGRPDMEAALQALAARGIGSVFVEGGAGLNDSLLDAGLIDRFHLLEGDVEIGANGVPATVHFSLPERLAALGFSIVERRALGCDMLTTFEKV
ncbi:bifunctional diaminohydroxyphosphoribosylaminopyrimidine deaminase/5-amino-6-(5-phosphoribosylamino)uracil reductase RibD [Pelagibacterium halotolerans]|uniref:Riboflavin biosynthesis protein RibD n=1 Tax=Pelagibacterium halotolerans (strain DSM 22347 / JCM 15775 / CGMCC 1.7692 / B2) TaxID=1082931 RepID=G4R643_PELHB|nr:bifunctional diaminohydroxyphosphoribosylaminopyrimidine deaminase/5-amino-6-(5-phosphoribosylamino)uracil reductase RibD [Pelagibacterium halotolerans]AEQ51158.1 diaminohydroxyphosphoribosylaminopyrimidine deaminase / 5-amino-6-(5-phosphoribosylamino)uracil reductase [Pelagibacterium halotolerans B2]QJR18971.1 bifunctional diaminohydroxyphosphoribosylaminopyrimidine deaminase/5-amino-6-(5-phosphoribosylamino)uracil reductase RibD [Pelagibacterium halotolerans]SEA69415.1 diaminohydroxyphospho